MPCDQACVSAGQRSGRRTFAAAENVFINSNLLIKVKMSQSIGPIPIVMETHSHVLCEQLQQLRNQNGLLDLDIMCEVR